MYSEEAAAISVEIRPFYYPQSIVKPSPASLDRFCRDASCPLNSTANSSVEVAPAASNSGVDDPLGASADSDVEDRPAAGNSSVLSLPDSPSTNLGLLSLRSPSSGFASSARVSAPNASRCMRNLFANPASTLRERRREESAVNASNTANATSASALAEQPSQSTSRSSASSTQASTVRAAMPSRSMASESMPSETMESIHFDAIAPPSSSAASDILDDSSQSTRFSLPSTSSYPISRPNRPEPEPEDEGVEEPSEVDVSMEPDVQDCLSLIRAAERKIVRRSQDQEVAAVADETSRNLSHRDTHSGNDVETSLSNSRPTGPSIINSSARHSVASSSTHSRSSPSAATDSTVISVAFTSSSSSSSLPSSPAFYTNAQDWYMATRYGIPPPDSGAGIDAGTRPRIMGDDNSGNNRAGPRPLKREISQGEMPSTKKFEKR